MHRKFFRHYEQLADRVGIQQAQQFWDHVSQEPGKPPAVGQTTILKGKAGKPQGTGWSRTVHYEVSSYARIDYQYNDEYQTSPEGDAHAVVAILTINYSSH
ncbi:hypothetical protein [Streptosporangium oxazolinicum]|uniref:hypothetical protein n=1 Tax=Streptosporangium oxazolinicum TaxID=909287 RepID=UPI0031ED7C30